MQFLDQMTTATKRKSTDTGVGNQYLVPGGRTQHWNKKNTAIIKGMTRRPYRSHCTVQQAMQVRVLVCHWVVSKIKDRVPLPLTCKPGYQQGIGTTWKICWSPFFISDWIPPAKNWMFFDTFIIILFIHCSSIKLRLCTPWKYPQGNPFMENLI